MKTKIIYRQSYENPALNYYQILVYDKRGKFTSLPDHYPTLESAQAGLDRYIESLQPRSLDVIAHEIINDWENISYYAIPYVRAMLSLHLITDHYGVESGSSIVDYFLANAKMWRGETARRIKAELKAMQKGL